MNRQLCLNVWRLTSVRIHSTPWLLLNIETPEKNPINSIANRHKDTDRAIINLKRKKDNTVLLTFTPKMKRKAALVKGCVDNWLIDTPWYEKAK